MSYGFVVSALTINKKYMVTFRKRRNSKLLVDTKSFVYGIYDPITFELVYIGYTVNFKSRVSYHLSATWETNKKAVYIKELSKKGMYPYFRILNEFENVKDAKEYESKEITRLMPILNTR